MTLKQLMVRYNWLNVEAVLLQEYPSCKKHLANYEEVYGSLLLLGEVSTDLQIYLQAVPDNQNRHNAVEVVGRRRVPHIAEVHLVMPYALHFTPWAEWLSMPVSLRSLAQFSETEIIAHCLVEMTRKGFDEATIQAQAQNLSNVMDEMSAQTGNDASLNWEELIKQLDTRRK